MKYCEVAVHDICRQRLTVTITSSGQRSIGPTSVPSDVPIPIPSQQQQRQPLTIQQQQSLSTTLGCGGK